MTLNILKKRVYIIFSLR